MTCPWNETSVERYDEMLGVLPPALMTGYGFLVGEPFDHRQCTVTKEIRARYAAFVAINGHYFESGWPLTIPEFKAVKLVDVIGVSV